MSNICVHGLGYVGLPTAAMLANHDHEVIGYDTSEKLIDELDRGEVQLQEPGLRAFVGQALQSGNLLPSSEPAPADYHLICVPTPLNEDNEADLRCVRDAGANVAGLLSEGDTVILESTVPPDTTDGILRPLLERDGLTVGENVSLAYSPETVLPGNTIHELKHNDRIVGGAGGTAVEPAVNLYDSFVAGEITTTSATTAEFAKLMQNTFRDVNIAFANEIARLCDEHGVDSREAIDLANSHPRVDVLQPGPGVGGHCLPTDPHFLLRESDGTSLIEAARRINDSMATHVIHLLEDLIGDLDGSRIAVLGVAYKGNVADVRGSPGLRIVSELLSNGSDTDVAIADPHVGRQTEILNHNGQTFPIRSIEEAVSDADAAVIATDHDEFADLNPEDLRALLRRPAIVDTKGVLDPDRWRSEGFEVVRV